MRKKIKRSGKFFVYIVQCKNGNYYTGYTSNLAKRIEDHNTGRGAKYLKGKGPIKLLFAKEFKYYRIALRWERDIKKLPRKQKELLISEYRNGKCRRQR